MHSETTTTTTKTTVRHKEKAMPIGQEFMSINVSTEKQIIIIKITINFGVLRSTF